MEADLAQVGLLRLALRHRRVREAVVQVAREVELAAFGDALRVRDRLRHVAKERRHLGRRAQVELRVRAALAVRAVQAGAVLDRDEHVLQAVALLPVVVDVARRDDACADVLRQVGERAVAAVVPVDEVVLQLDEEVVLAEPLGVAPGHFLRLAIAPGSDERRHLAVPAAGERDQPLRVPREDVRLDARRTAFVVEVGVRQQAAEVGVAALRLAEERQVVARSRA